MNYGFVINNRTCIGCHACSTACKSENEVPLGVYRTWVRYTEVGAYPDVQRNFQVTRCNHCANPPCVRICPTTAMYQRHDGIVEFDSEQCIGCKACMQACPYDAIYIDPETHTAAKCHYCSHRTEIGLEPACVVVCPEHAIIAGDLDDPMSEISRVMAKEKVTVRKPEQGTAPKLFYIDGDDTAMQPTATPRNPDTYMWADVVTEGQYRPTPRETNNERAAFNGTRIRIPDTQGVRRAEQMVQVGYNAQHKVPWHWPVPAYLVTKGIAAGIALLLAAAWLSGTPISKATGLSASIATVAFLLITTGLLVFDLEHPERFLRILLRPQFKSWLVRGAFLLIAFSTLASAWVLVEIAGMDQWRGWLLVLQAPLAIGTAIYTAFLFGQAEGRDLWQSPLLPFHLLVQAVMAGAAAALIAAPIFGWNLDTTWLRAIFVAAVALDLFVTLFGELGMPHATDVAAAAAHDISHGRYWAWFWFGSVVAGHLLPLGLVFAGQAGSLAAGVLVLGGLYAYEHAFVMAPQQIPNS